MSAGDSLFLTLCPYPNSYSLKKQIDLLKNKNKDKTKQTNKKPQNMEHGHAFPSTVHLTPILQFIPQYYNHKKA